MPPQEEQLPALFYNLGVSNLRGNQHVLGQAGKHPVGLVESRKELCCLFICQQILVIVNKCMINAYANECELSLSCIHGLETQA